MSHRIIQRARRFLLYAKIAIRSPQPYQRLRDLIIGNLLFALPIPVRKRIFNGQPHFCPVCETPLRGFLVLHRPYHRWCPVCRSLPRHRLLYLFLNRYGFIISKTAQTVLHFAPELGIARRLMQLPHFRYITTDIEPSSIHVCSDIEHLSFPNDAFTLILCLHVLEHIPDDLRAMRELYRVLKPGGTAIVMVPITSPATVEDPTITDPVLRERLFGQHDHVRRYGQDVVLRLGAAGFVVERIGVNDIVTDPTEITLMGLPEKETIFVCRKIV
ncbi:class I SAM-dependent methyltransferase [Chloroflexus aurantiacus]